MIIGSQTLFLQILIGELHKIPLPLPVTTTLPLHLSAFVKLSLQPSCVGQQMILISL